MANKPRIHTLEDLAFAVFYENLDRYEIDGPLEIPLSTKKIILRQLAHKRIGSVAMKNLWFVLDPDLREWDLYLPEDAMIMALGVCSRLEQLTLYQSPFDDKGFGVVAPFLGHLRRLTINRMGNLRDGSSLCQVLASYRATLQTLEIVECQGLTLHALRDVPYNFNLPVLTSMSFDRNSPIIDKALLQLLQRTPNLENLRLENCNNVTSVSLQAALVGCPRLRSFTVRNIRGLDHALIFSSGATPDLRTLDIEGCDQMPALGIDTTHRPLNLEALNLVRTSGLPAGAYQMLALCCKQLRSLSVSSLHEDKPVHPSHNDPDRSLLFLHLDALREIVATAHHSLEAFTSYSLKPPLDLLATAPSLTALHIDQGNVPQVIPDPFTGLKKLRLTSDTFRCRSTQLTELDVRSPSFASPPITPICLGIECYFFQDCIYIVLRYGVYGVGSSRDSTTVHQLIAQSAASLTRVDVQISTSVPQLSSLESGKFHVGVATEDISLQLLTAKSLTLEGDGTHNSHAIVIDAPRLRSLTINKLTPLPITLRSASLATVEINNCVTSILAPLQVPAECPLELLRLQECILSEESLTALCAVRGVPVVKITKSPSLQVTKVEDGRTTLLPLRIRVGSTVDFAIESAHLTAAEIMSTTSLRRLEFYNCVKLQLLRFPEKPAPACYGAIRSLSLRRCETLAVPALLKALDQLVQLVELDLFDVQSLNSSASFQPLLMHRTLKSQLTFLDVGRLRMLTQDDLRQLFQLAAIRKLGLHGLIGARYKDAVGDQLRLVWRSAHPQASTTVDVEYFVDDSPRI